MMGLSRPIINEKTGGEVATYLYYHTHPPGASQPAFATADATAVPEPGS